MLFEKIISNTYKDFDENPYIYEFLLSCSEETIACEALDFLGKGEEKLKVIRKKYVEIMEVRKK